MTQQREGDVGVLSAPSLIQVPIGDSGEHVSIDPHNLSQTNVEDILGVLQSELAPLRVWLECAKAYLAEDNEEAFLEIVGSGCSPEIEQYYPNDVYGRAKLLCCSAAHQVNVAARLRLGGGGKGGGQATTNTQRRAEHLTRADKLLQRAFAIASKEQVVAITRAHLLFEKGEKPTAEKILDSALAMKDGGRDNVAAMLWKARRLFVEERKYSESLTWYKRALKMHPQAPAEVRLGLAACHFAMKDFASARLAFARAADMDNECVDAYVGLAKCDLAEFEEVGTKEHAEAVERSVENLYKAFEIDPTNPLVSLTLAEHYLYSSASAGTSSEELKNIETLTDGIIKNEKESSVFRAEALFIRAQAFHASGNLPSALTYYQSAIDLDKNFAAPHFGVAQIFLKQNDAFEAKKHCERAQSAYPESLFVKRAFGKLCAAVGDSKRAVEMYDFDPYKRDGTDFQTMLELGELLERSDATRALEAYEKAMNIAKKVGDSIDAVTLNNVGVLRARLVTSTTGAEKEDNQNNKDKNISKNDDTDVKNKEASLHSLEESLDILYPEAAPNVAPKLQKGDKKAIDLAKKLPARRERLRSTWPKPKRFSAKRRNLRTLNKSNPDDIDVALRKAIELCERFGDFEGALTKITEALKRNPGNADAVATSGWVLMKQRRWKEAEQQFEELRELPSDLAEEDKFHLRNAAGGGDEASKKDDDKTLKLDEYALVSAGNAAYYSALKEGLHKRSDPKIRQREDDHYKRAESLYKKALVKEPTNAFAANGLAILLAERGRMDDAKAVFTLVQESLEIENAGIAGTSASAATKILSELQADVLVNLGHIALAKAQYAASLKFYDRAQQEFYHGTSHEIMLFQARAHYENQNLLQAKKTLQEALHIAPMNHRVRFNLAYVVQELAQRSLNDTLKSVSSEGRVARVEKALENIQVALHMFTQLKELGNQPKFGFDTKRTTVHANFCKQALEKSKPHLEKAHAEEEKLMKSKKAQMEARKALEEGRAKEKAAKALEEEQKKRELEAIAAESERRFKETRMRWEARAQAKKGGKDYNPEDGDDMEDGGEGAVVGGEGVPKKKKKPAAKKKEKKPKKPTTNGSSSSSSSLSGSSSDSDSSTSSDSDDDVDTKTAKAQEPQTEEEKAKLKENAKAALAAAGLFDSDDDDKKEENDAPGAAFLAAANKRKEQEKNAEEDEDEGEKNAEEEEPSKKRRVMIDDSDDDE
ncbi:unnamed protein product [Bathycoccus prasinos]